MAEAGLMVSAVMDREMSARRPNAGMPQPSKGWILDVYPTPLGLRLSRAGLPIVKDAPAPGLWATR